MAFKRSAVRSRLSPPNTVPETRRFRNFFVYFSAVSSGFSLFSKFHREAPKNTLEAPLAELSRIRYFFAHLRLSNASFISIASKFSRFV